MLTGITLVSCKKSFLEEVPLDFLSPENSFVTYNDFNSAVADLYGEVRTEFYTRDERGPFHYIHGCDLVYDGEPHVNRFTPLESAINPNSSITNDHWFSLFGIVASANTIIDLAPASEMTDEEKKLITAKAKFFRAFAYRTLAYLYGGVPLSLSAVTEPKNDYTRASREDVYGQCITDLVDAVRDLPEIDAVLDGEINKQAAGHLLAEVYLAAGKYKDAVDAATAVISSPKVGLMTSRFGKKSTVANGNVYWDLFQPGNQNYKSANNREALWVIQFEVDVPGGSASSTQRGGNYLLERQYVPYIGGLNSLFPDKKNPFVWPADDLNSGGRGIGWAIPTTHFTDGIWQSDFNNDERNANINYYREFVGTNPSSSFYGKTISTQNPPPKTVPREPSRRFYAYQTKATTPGGHPSNLLKTNGMPLELTSTAGGTFLDQYMFRLAETYLIRAEAYLGLSNTGKAADDLNEVRNRSKASDVASGDVTIDYILDERMRELGIEEKRRLTLMRLGLLYDRVKKYNTHFKADIQKKHNLWPIPFSEIQANQDAEITQNPGY